MKHLGKLAIIIALSGFIFINLEGQETVAASGGNASGSKGSVSYTIGQIAFSALTGTEGSVVQGVQQPYEISVITSVEDPEETSLKCVVYPNPTRDAVRLSVVSSDYIGMSYRLYDINGILIREMKVVNEETEIQMQNLTPSTYILRVSRDKKELKTFKIIKN